jgi:hypothetical protein
VRLAQHVTHPRRRAAPPAALLRRRGGASASSRGRARRMRGWSTRKLADP